MRKPDKTIVFGSQNEALPPSSQAPTLRGSDVSFPQPAAFPAARSASPTTGSMRAPTSLRSPTSREVEKVWFGSGPVSGAPISSTPLALSQHRLADDLVDERPTYLRGSERGLAFAAISLALLGVAAAGTYFFFGTRDTVVEEPAAVSTTTVTNADVPATPAPTPAATPPDQPWEKQEVDAVRDPRIPKPQIAATTEPKTTAPKDVSPPGAQLMPTERPQATSTPPAVEATKIQGKQPAAAPVPKAKRTPPPGMSDEALERAGFYGNLNKAQDSAPNTYAPPPPDLTPSAASTEEPSQFTPKPEPSNVMPDVTIKQ